MNSASSDNKLIAYNTIVLYVKLILTLIIGLYTSRCVLMALGDSDFGLYSVVGGIVVLLNVLGVTMVSTSYRFIGVEIGKGDKGNPNKTFNSILVIHISLALLIIALGLIIGLWYVNNYLNVADGKLADARYVLIVSLITTVFTIISVPSNGLIMAREKFLYISLIEILQAVLKLLLVVFVLSSYDGNHLRLFANLNAFVVLIAPVAYTGYCYIKDRDIIKWNFNKNWTEYKKILSFTGWMSVSTLSFMGTNQGAATILNFFFGTVINAAFGLSNQIMSCLQMAPRNIIQATSPQIIKNYSGGNLDRSLSLTYLSTKYCFFILLLPSVPALLFINEIMALWLGNVPMYTATFTSLMILALLVGSITNGFDSLIMATGKIRLFQMNYSVLNLSLLPIIYVLYSLGFPPYANAIVMIVLNVLSVLIQIVIISRVIDFKIIDYYKKTIVPVFMVVISNLPLFYLRLYIKDISLLQLIMYTSLIIFWVGISIFMLGINSEERKKVKSFINRKIIRK